MEQNSNSYITVVAFNEIYTEILFATNGQVDVTFFVSSFHDNALFQRENLTFLASIMIST